MTKRRIKKTRSIKGTRVKPVLKAFNCRNCGSPIEVKVVGHTLNVVCPSCKSVIDAKDPSYEVLQTYQDKKEYTPFIPLGAKGKLKGKLWQCTGFIVKSDSGYYWSEYLLYNPYHGYRWLVEVNGHWVLYKKIHGVETSAKAAYAAKYKNKGFKLFNHGVSTVEYVEGEFYWRIQRGDKATVSDYISPPEALSVEYTEFEENWSLGYHIDADTLKKSFKLPHLPYREGVGMIEPSTTKEKVKKNFATMSQVVLLIVLIHGVRSITASKKVVFDKALTYVSSKIDRDALYKSEEFEITGRTTNIEIKADTSVYNAWVYIDSLLVDAETQKGIPMPLEVSYYRGPGWREGKREKSRIINNIPPGRYYLSIRFKSGPREYRDTIRYRIIRDVPVTSNFIVALVSVVLTFLFGFFQSRSFEVRRWSNSDYSPYHQS